MKIIQKFTNNKGVIDTNLLGYQHGDALTSEGHEAHLPIRQDMITIANKIVKNHPKAKYFLDVGSGAAYLSEALRKINNDFICVSLDGNLESINLPSIDKKYHFIVRTDEDYELIDENGNIIKFDVVTSFEHLEHIHVDKFDIFIKNIKKHMSLNCYFYATAAKWTYNNNDRVHINIKNKDQWHNEMIKYGFEETEDVLFCNNEEWACKLRWDETNKINYKLRN